MSKIAVLALTQDPGLRRMAEDAAAAHMKGAQAVPSYQVVGDSDLRNREQVKAKLLAQGFQGRARDASRGHQRAGHLGRRTLRDLRRLLRLGGRGGLLAGIPADRHHRARRQQSLLAEQNKLIWSGVSQTFDPASAKSFMNDVSKAVAKSLQQDLFIL